MIKTAVWKEQLANLNEEKERMQKQSDHLVRKRLFAFLILIVGVFIYDKSMHIAGYFLCSMGIVLFVYFVYQHSKVKQLLLYNQYHCRIIQRYLDRRNDNWMNFEEKGEAFLKECDPTFLDLDIVGDHSLYQLICAAKSALGKRKLYEYFSISISMKETAQRREAIEELVAKLDDSMKFQIALEGKLSEKDERILINDVHLHEFCDLNDISGIAFLRFLPIITMFCGVLGLLSILPIIVFYGLLLLQFTLSAIYTLKEKKRISCYQDIHSCYAKDSNLFEICEEMSFESKYLKELHSHLVNKGRTSVRLKQLDTALSMFSLRNNVILYVVFNALFMFDIQYLYIIEKWRANHADQIQKWCQTLAHMEALLSCSLLVYARDKTCIPVVNEDDHLRIQAVKCAHPLINEQSITYNDFTLQGSCIITGSNMSGKSTFMRCVGFNVLLANSGCRVCAETFECPAMHVVSSMRLKDELAANISSFYAEILRIKTIMETGRHKQPVLILIDEIFKGTNSIDRICGAKEVIRKLNQPWIITMITTHDLELCDELNDLYNYHFKEHYIENEIHFDYLLHQGKCTTTNAMHLMKLAGIID